MKEPSAIEKAQVANIIKKAKAGKVLTAREEGIIQKYEASQKPSNPFDIDNTGLAAFFGMTSKTICAWVKQGMPKESFGLYNLKKCFDWWCENIDDNKTESDPTITALKAENLRIKNDRERMKRDTEKGLLFPKADISSEWVKRIAEVRQGLLSLPVRLAPLVDGKTQDEIRAIIKEAVYRLLTAYSRDGRFTPPEKKGKKK